MVILVDEYDNPLGTMPKMEAHKKGLLHRAFSVLIFNTEGEMLLQRRAFDKYHSGGLWTNTCCSHPAPGIEIADAAVKRLQEEMGIRAEIYPITSFIYQAHLDHGLQEHELDHVYVGVSDEVPEPNPEEVCEYKYLSVKKIRTNILENPDSYTEWFKIILDKLEEQKEK
ncbi:MAG: isopentenyl-diphosphate Delta-isomerase [Bacteroidales bacterium]|nr:isopentenyl-diphosphate Delta-isomerase [Bacteroidales bacterium]